VSPLPERAGTDPSGRVVHHDHGPQQALCLVARGARRGRVLGGAGGSGGCSAEENPGARQEAFVPGLEGEQTSPPGPARRSGAAARVEAGASPREAQGRLWER
jgi:hypothetical protein